MISHAEMLTRIAVGAAFGGIIGYERDKHRRPVGLRTHLIVAMAAATFMVVSSQFVYFQHYGKDDLVVVDTSRIAASVVTGIGFLAGGAILRIGANIHGLTTAAGLWLVTAIGMCSGAGMYVEGGTVTALGMVALTVLRRLEDKKDDVVRRRVSIVLGPGEAGIDDVIAALQALGSAVADIEYETRIDAPRKRAIVTFEVEIARTMAVGTLIGAIEKVPNVRRVQVGQAI